VKTSFRRDGHPSAPARHLADALAVRKKKIAGSRVHAHPLQHARSLGRLMLGISRSMISVYSPRMGTTGLLTVRLRRPDDDDFIRDVAQESFARWSHAPKQSIMAMLHGQSARTLVAEKDDKRLGFAIVTFEALAKPFGPWPRPIIAHLDAIAVPKDARRAGIGQIMLAGAETLAREYGAVGMTLNTARSNKPALSLFASYGYQVTFLVPEFYRNGEPAFAMTRLLAE
jgi:ribosomal protein S18 acetylase RimI-like enzyme